MEVAQVLLLPVDLNLRAPFSDAAMPANTLEAARIRGRLLGICLVLGLIAKPQITDRVISAVAIDVVDLLIWHLAIGAEPSQAVRHDPLPINKDMDVSGLVHVAGNGSLTGSADPALVGECSRCLVIVKTVKHFVAREHRASQRNKAPARIALGGRHYFGRNSGLVRVSVSRCRVEAAYGRASPGSGRANARTNELEPAAVKTPGLPGLPLCDLQLCRQESDVTCASAVAILPQEASPEVLRRQAVLG